MVEFLGQSLPVVLFTLGVILAIAEAIAPGAHLIVVGVALIVAGLVGILLMSVPGITGALLAGILAAIVLIAGSVALWGYRELDLYKGTEVGRTKDSTSLRGSTGRVTDTVTPTGGEIKLDSGGFNPYYRARSIDGEIPEGTEVVVIDPGGGNVLQVESLGAIEDDIDRELALGRNQAKETESARE